MDKRSGTALPLRSWRRVWSLLANRIEFAAHKRLMDRGGKWPWCAPRNGVYYDIYLDGCNER